MSSLQHPGPQGSLMAPPPQLEFKPDDVYIAVMGVTGAGKSTFISKLCQAASSASGHGLKSVTKEIATYTFEHEKKVIRLIDTPGFDDTYKTDSDVLRDLAYWLTKSYDKGLKLTGIIYLHPITHNRMSGTAFKNLRTFRKLCGKQSLSSVVLATTMWENVNPPMLGDQREQELLDEPTFWGDMKSEGSKVMRHQNSRDSALSIISYLVNRNQKTVLGLQVEMVDQNRSLEDTEAGREVDQELREQRDAFERRLESTRQELQEAIKEKDQEHIDEILKEQNKFETKLAAIQKGRDELRISMEKLIAEKDKQHMEEMGKMRDQLNRSNENLQKQIEEYEKFKRFQEAQNQQHEAERKESEEKFIALQQYAAEADVAAFLLYWKAKEQELNAAEAQSQYGGSQATNASSTPAPSVVSSSTSSPPPPPPPPYQEFQYPSQQAPMPNFQPYPQYPQYQQYPQQWSGPPPTQPTYNEGLNMGVGASVGAMSGLAMGGAAALGLCNVM